MGRAIRVADIRAAGVEPGKHWADHRLLQPRLVTVQMGDRNATSMAQHVHEQVLATAGVSPERLLQYGCPAGAEAVQAGVYIDDFGVAEAVGPEQPWREAPQLVARWRAAWRAEGVEEKRSKTVEGARNATLWGGQLVDGRRWSAAVGKTQGLVGCSLRVARARVSTPHLVQRLAGLWVHVCMFRRPLLCLLQETFRFARRPNAQQVQGLPPGVRDELLGLALCAPAARTMLDAPVLPRLLAHDAEGSGGGALVEASLPRGVAEQLWRFSDQRGWDGRAPSDGED